MYCTYWLYNFYIFIWFLERFIPFYMYFADVPPDDPLGETYCRGLNFLMSIL